MLLISCSVFLLNLFFPFVICECDLKKFEKASIVPAIISKPPQEELQVIYGGKTITCGQNLSITVPKEVPEVKYETSNDHYYALVMIDPDAPYPNDPKYANFLHWLVVNIKGNQVKKGETIKTYEAPSPPSDSSAHRYIFLVYRQPRPFNDSTTRNLRNEGRPRFSLDNMKKKLGLKELVAANFFYTRQS